MLMDKRSRCRDKTTVVTHSDASFASVFYLTINAAHLVEKHKGCTTLQDVPLPLELDAQSQRTLQAAPPVSHERPLAPSWPLTHTAVERHPNVARLGPWYSFGNVAGKAETDVESAFRKAFLTLRGE